MYSLNDYVDALLFLVSREKIKGKRSEIVQSWLKLLKKHHRSLESKKILAILDNKIRRKESAKVTVASVEEAKILDTYFKSRGVTAESEVNPQILAGAKVVWGNLLIDNTLQSQLDKLKKNLTL